MNCKITGKQCEYTGCNESNCVKERLGSSANVIVSVPQKTYAGKYPFKESVDNNDTWDEVFKLFIKDCQQFKSKLDAENYQYWLKINNYKLIKL